MSIQNIPDLTRTHSQNPPPGRIVETLEQKNTDPKIEDPPGEQLAASTSSQAIATIARISSATKRDQISQLIESLLPDLQRETFFTIASLLDFLSCCAKETQCDIEVLNKNCFRINFLDSSLRTTPAVNFIFIPECGKLIVSVDPHTSSREFSCQMAKWIFDNLGDQRRNYILKYIEPLPCEYRQDPGPELGANQQATNYEFCDLITDSTDRTRDPFWLHLPKNIDKIKLFFKELSRRGVVDYYEQPHTGRTGGQKVNQNIDEILSRVNKDCMIYALSVQHNFRGHHKIGTGCRSIAGHKDSQDEGLLNITFDFTQENYFLVRKIYEEVFGEPFPYEKGIKAYRDKLQASGTH